MTKSDAAVIKTITLYGRATQVRILKIHPFGTVDVPRLSDGACFRVSGLSLEA